MITNSRKIKYLIGIDEVGRGPLAGPVCVCAFIVPINRRLTQMTELRSGYGAGADKCKKF
ncbi:MAG: hypothetical protein Athens071416_7 [Parcubacteria group bacterium Athens0714_16]|nr:MAG: hypothetical protein Athens071416_7 [Parcubacteria group bacterium Athens0714_16]